MVETVQHGARGKYSRDPKPTGARGKRTIKWFSRVANVIVAASSEPEYIALSEIVNEVRILLQGKEFNGVGIKMEKIRFSSRRTAYVAIKHYIAREHVRS